MFLTRCSIEGSSASESGVEGSYATESQGLSGKGGEDDEDRESDYELDMKDMYISCQVFKHPDTVLHMDISLKDRYSSLKNDLENVFCRKMSLIDLARRLENDLLIYEIPQPNPGQPKFKLCYKDEVFCDILGQFSEPIDLPDTEPNSY